jgi:hypothetical protein
MISDPLALHSCYPAAYHGAYTAVTAVLYAHVIRSASTESATVAIGVKDTC